MRLTRAGEYAIRCMIYLSHRGQNVLVARQEIAERAEIPAHFLAKIAQQLAKARLIAIRQGAKGGYLLLQEPAEISLLAVVEEMIGEISLNDCVARPEGCTMSRRCRVHRVWDDASQQLRQNLAAISLAELAADETCIPVFAQQGQP